jgi:hypothetical protein
LFRFDGILPIPHWKRLLSDFFRGNKLIPEYLGAPEDVNAQSVVEPPMDVSDATRTESGAVTLAALITLEPGSIDGPIQICSEYFQEFAGQLIPYVEIGVGEVAAHLRTHLDPNEITLVGFMDGVLNLGRIRFGSSDNLKIDFDTEVSALARAFRRDVEMGVTHRAAIPFTWEHEGLLVTLTVAGDADKVATMLEQLHTVVDLARPPSDWIEPLSDLIKVIAPRQRSEVNWNGVRRGILSIKRSGTVTQKIIAPDAIKQLLLPTGTTVPKEGGEARTGEN